jgi:hypothetical protein
VRQRSRAAIFAACAIAVAASCARSTRSTRSNPAHPTSAPATPAGAGAAAGLSDADRRIAFYEAKLASLPRHYPSLALLASAQLDKVKETGDPSWVAAARSSVQRSMAIQPNAEAMKAGAAIASYSHRFAAALTAARAARAVYPADTSVASLEVEAQLGLGELDAAEQLLTTFPADDFHAAFARGLVAVARKRYPQAALEYAKAADRAAAESVTSLQVFALVSAAGALPYLDRAAVLSPMDRRLGIHRAEWMEKSGHPEQALVALEALLAQREDAELHRRACRLARAAGDGARAQRHFDAARAGYQRAIDAGEGYTLEAMSYLLSEADVELPLAVTLAQRNLETKRDASARAALTQATARLAATSSSTPSR